MRARIIGTGRALPKLIVNNKDFEKFIETSDEWIQERTGMVDRHIITDETLAGLGSEAANKALEMAGVKAEEIDIIIATTATADKVYPNLACEIQAIIGNHLAMCVDLNAACSGFIYAAATAQAYIKSGMAQKILVVSAEMLSKNTDYADRGTCILFADGAAAAVFSASEEGGIIDAVYHADGARGDSLTMDGLPRANHWVKACDNKSYIKMDGKAIYAFATRTVPEVINELLDKSGNSVGDIDLFVLHQANGRMLQVIARKLGVEEEKIPVNVQKYGNTSSATIPILLDELVRAGRIKPGDKIVMSGFGAGVTWGAVLLEW